MASYQGPIKKGGSESSFRATGYSVGQVELTPSGFMSFDPSGKGVPRGGGSSSSGGDPQAQQEAERLRQQQEAERLRLLEIKRQQELQKQREEAQKLQEKLRQERLAKIKAGRISGQLSSQNNQFSSGTRITGDFGKVDVGEIYTKPTLTKDQGGYTFIEPPKSGTGAFTYTKVTPKYTGGTSGLGATLTFDLGESYEPLTIPASGTGEVVASSLNPTLTEKIKITSQKSETKIRKGGFEGIKGGATSLALGAGSAVYGIGSSIIHPVQTAKGIGSAILNPSQTAKTGIESLRTGFKQNPSFVLGEFAGYYGVGKGLSLAQKGVLKGTDIYRTRGLVELEATDVIAPEFYAGQTYPKIKPGQTAGSLLGEFKPAGQYGVTKLTGFTSAPKPLAGEVVGAGSSELPGLYQAPKISPKFLRVGGEETKVFSLNIFGDTLRPSVFKVKPQEFKLVPGVKPSQRDLFGLGKAKQFYSSRAEQGKSYVPFVKTEKEAVIPAGTEFNLVDKRFFFRFEGRRIPIFEYETSAVKNIKGTGAGSGTITSNELIESISRSRIGSRARYSPVDILGYSSLVSGRVSKSQASRVIYSKRPRPKSYYYAPKSSSYFSSSYFSPSYTRGVSYGGYNILGSGSYAGGYSGTPKSPIISKPASLQRIKLRMESKKPTQIFIQPTKYQASLTSEVLGITSKEKPSSSILGISVRPIIQSKPKRNALSESERAFPIKKRRRDVFWWM